MKLFSENTTIKAMCVAALALSASFAQATRVSHVESNTLNNGNGTYTYNFTVFNDSHLFQPVGCGGASSVAFAPNGSVAAVSAAATVSDPSDCLLHRITEWSMPYFGDSGITNIFSPNARWFSSIDTIGIANAATRYDGGTPTWLNPADPFYFGAASPFSAVTQILRWYTFDTCGDGCTGFINPQLSQTGFGFTSIYGAVAAPYDAGWIDERRRSGDPDFPGAGLPGSPLALGATNQVPAPAAWLLLALGLVPIIRRVRKQA
jgi:hypothetical protein